MSELKTCPRCGSEMGKVEVEIAGYGTKDTTRTRVTRYACTNTDCNYSYDEPINTPPSVTKATTTARKPK